MATIRNNNLQEIISKSNLKFQSRDTVLEIPEGIPYTNLLSLLFALKRSNDGAYQKAGAIARCVLSLNPGLKLETLVSKVNIHLTNDLGLRLTRTQIRTICSMIVDQSDDLQPEANDSVRYVTNPNNELDMWKRVTMIARFRVKNKVLRDKPLIAFVNGLIDAGVNPLSVTPQLLRNNTRFAQITLDMNLQTVISQVFTERQITYATEIALHAPIKNIQTFKVA